MSDSTDHPDDAAREAGEAVYQALLTRVGEGSPQPRLEPTRRALDLLGDPQGAYPIIHITGTNGKTSTSRISESILRAYGLRTGLLTSPHLERFNERIMIDGEPITDELLASNWADIQPYLTMVDDELTAQGEPALTFFEALTVLAFAAFADAPVDVAVIEVGMGGEWDSTNVADGQVAVFTPISLDHVGRLGNTIAEIARTKSGIIKPAATVVTSAQVDEAMAELVRAAQITESRLIVEGQQLEVTAHAVAVGGQVISVRGLAASYNDLFLPLFGDHQAQNAAVAIGAVEAFLGGGGHQLSADLLAEGLATVTSPGRLQLIGTDPTVLLDAAHNPAGAESLTAALGEYFTFDEVCVVTAVLNDKDSDGIIRALDPIATRFHVTQSASDRSLHVDELADRVETLTERPDDVIRFSDLGDAIETAREWASDGDRRAVVVTGSITLVAEALTFAAAAGWRNS